MNDDPVFEFPLCEDVHGTCSNIAVEKSKIYGLGKNPKQETRCILYVGPNTKYAIDKDYTTVRGIIYGNNVTVIPRNAE